MKIEQHQDFLLDFLLVLLVTLDVLGCNPGRIHHADMLKLFLGGCRSLILKHLEVSVEQRLVDEL